LNMYLSVWGCRMGEGIAPLVTVCIPAFNAAATIGDSLRSVIEQSYRNIRIVAVDNHSIDATLEVVRRFDDPRLEIHSNPTNLGGEGNFNRCIELASGKYTAIYHADDIYDSDMVAEQVHFLERYGGASAVFAEAWIIDEQGRRTGAISQPAELRAVGPLHDFASILKAVMRHSNFLICPSVMAQTSVYQSHIRGWRGELFGSSADLDVWLRMLAIGPIGILPRKLMSYRIGTHQGSAPVRHETRRAAFFAVLDYYLAKPDVRELLSTADMDNYGRLERRDLVMRSANALIAGDSQLAGRLCPELLTKKALSAALTTRRGLVVWLLSIGIRCSVFLGLQTFARGALMFAKKSFQK
jgi:glycosyltransferase involved in cell wall biosynthesis